MALCVMSLADDSEQTFFDEDPIVYENGPPERRVSSTPTSGGDRVWQDFGAPDVDRQIRLRTDWMSGVTLIEFAEKFAVVGQVWKWIDHNAAEFRVLFRALTPTRIRGYDAYEVEMTFDVVEVVA